jgi:hypothetical protein
VAFVATAMAVFALAVRFLPIFPDMRRPAPVREPRTGRLPGLVIAEEEE